MKLTNNYLIRTAVDLFKQRIANSNLEQWEKDNFLSQFLERMQTATKEELKQYIQLVS